MGAGCEVSKAGLYEAYAEWCEKSGEKALSKKRFWRAAFTEKGFSDDRDRDKGRFWRGIELETSVAR